MKDHHRSQAGVDVAFAALFEQYQNLVYRTAYLLLGDRLDAEDALQEVMWQVYRSLDLYDPAKGAFTTWLHKITVNHCLNRQRIRRPVIGLDEANLGRHHAAPSPEHAAETDDMVNHLLGSLSDKLRTVAVLRYVWDLSYEEIAEVLDIPLGTVQSRLHLALKAVRQQFAAHKSDSGSPMAGGEASHEL